MTKHISSLFARLIVLALVIAIASPIAACGRKGSPDYPKDSKYPRSYPKP
ncbi:MAG: hypothetical protein ISR45_10090 [Rhodospirillales bacterium]|nr:hypothetical protein [Rhodospirillales bacterium]